MGAVFVLGFPLVSVGQEERFRRADSNADGSLDVSDCVAVVRHLFVEGGEAACLDAVDADDNGDIEITDAVFIASFLFADGSAPPAPGPIDCGPDPTPDDLDCNRFDLCARDVDAAGPDPIGRIAYYDLDVQRNVLDFVNLRTGERTRVSDPTKDVSLGSPAPAVSPDYRYVVFEEDGELRIADGTTVVTVPVMADWTTLSISPDSQKIAASSTVSGGFAIFDRSGSVLTSTSDFVGSGRADGNTLPWNADSTAVAVRTDRDFDGRQELRLFEFPFDTSTDVAGNAPARSQISFLDWTEDGQYVVYVEHVAVSSRDGEVVVVNRAGDERMTVSQPGEDAIWFGGDMSVKAHDNTVVYKSEVNGREQLASADLDGQNHTVLASNADKILWWFGAGRALRNSDGVLSSSRTDGSESQRIDTDVTDVRPSSSNRFAMYLKSGGGPRDEDVHVAEADGSNPVKINDAFDLGRRIRSAFGLGDWPSESFGAYDAETVDATGEATRAIFTFSMRPAGHRWDLVVSKDHERREFPTGATIDRLDIRIIDEDLAVPFVTWRLSWLVDYSGTLYICSQDVTHTWFRDGNVVEERDDVLCEQFRAFQYAFLGVGY